MIFRTMKFGVLAAESASKSGEATINFVEKSIYKPIAQKSNNEKDKVINKFNQ